ncbi:MAG TPA: DUF1259 domain-containing protein [Fimbriimonadaceae bacterium]|nr:DUF1259 domain-containing protein [Fimbriimonadaceae bacterium]
MGLLRCVSFTFIFASLASAATQSNPWAAVVKTFGVRARVVEGGCVVTAYRTDLQVQNAAGMVMAPQMGLLSTIRFSGPEPQCAAEGEICAIQQEIDPVVDDLRIGGLDVEWLSNRFAGETPGLYFIRFRGQGDEVKLVLTIKRALEELGKDRFVSEGLLRTGKVPVVDWQAVSLNLGFAVSKVGGSEVMGGTKGRSWVSFGGCPCGQTQLSGLLVVDRAKLQDAIDALRRTGNSLDSISALDNSTMEIGFEAEGDALRLAQGVRKAFSDLAS